jgi:ABC-type amino acid transport substrate-binding protein
VAARPTLKHLPRALAALVFAAAVVAIAVIGLRACQQTPALTASVLRVGIDPSSPPFAFYDGEALAGFEVDLALQIASSLSVPVQWVALGFDGLYDAIRTEQVDLLLATLSPDPLRTQDVRYSDAYFDNGLVLVTIPSASINGMEMLAGRRLAYALGSAAHAEADRWLRRIAPFESRRYELSTYALDAMALGDADAALVSHADALLYLSTSTQTPLDTTIIPITHVPYVIAMRHDRAALHTAVNALLREYAANGTLDTLIQRWF